MRRFLFDLLRRAGEANSFQVRGPRLVAHLPAAADAAAVRRQSADQRGAVEVPAAHRVPALHPRPVGARLVHQREGGALADRPLLAVRALSDDAARDRPRARSRRAEQRAGRRLLPGRRARLGDAQPVDLPGALSHQGRPQRLRLPAERGAQPIQFHGSIIADYTFSVEDPLSQDNDFVVGLQPGDLTKYMALPWQSDFNECTTQPINITYADWNNLWPDSDNDERTAPGREDLDHPVVAGAPAIAVRTRSARSTRPPASPTMCGRPGAAACRRLRPATSRW